MYLDKLNYKIVMWLIMISNVLSLLFFLALGYLINRKIDLKRLKIFIKWFLVYLGIPGIVLCSLLSFDVPMADLKVISAAVTISLFINMLFSFMGNRVLGLKDKGVFILLISFPNSGFLGLPICYVLFGDLGLYYASIYVLMCTIIHYTIGLFFSLQSEFKDIKYALHGVGRFPVVYSMGAVLLLITLDLDLPGAVLSSLDYLGEVTSFLAVFYIGMSLELYKDKSMKKLIMNTTYVGSFRFFILPLVMFLLCVYFKIEPKILVLESMMPPAIANTVLAAHYSMNKELCANITTILTVAFIITFFLLFELVSYV